MPSDLCLPVLAAAVLLWGLVSSLCQAGGDESSDPAWVWREALAQGWSDWAELKTLSPTAAYDVVLTTVRDGAHVGATAVQFASVVHPVGAPEYTLRVLFVSAVRDTAHDLGSVGRGV